MKRVDVAIVGGGPAGISAAIWCVELGLKYVLFEREAEVGGQMLSTHGPVHNYPGLRAGNGRELRDLFLAHAAQSGIEPVTRTGVVEADLSQRTLSLADGTAVRFGNLVIATGVRRQQLGIPGEIEFADRGMLRSGVLARESVKGKKVVIVGGGDAALENALILSKTAERVTVVHRGDHFRARNEFVSAAGEESNISFLFGSRVTEIVGSGTIEAVTIEETLSSERSRLATDFILVRIGVEPNSELFADQLDTDEQGYIRTDSTCLTSRSGIYAIGDIAHPTSPTIATAVGTGATAAKSMASAVYLQT